MTTSSAYRFFILLPCATALVTSHPAEAQNRSWRDRAYLVTLRNGALEAVLQAGLLVGLKDSVTGGALISVAPEQLPDRLPVFGETGIDLHRCRVLQKKRHGGVVNRLESANGVVAQRFITTLPGGSIKGSCHPRG